MNDAVITPINVGRLRFDFSDVYRLRHESAYYGHIAHVPIFGYHIQLAERSVLVDAVAYNADGLSEVRGMPDYQPPTTLYEQLRSQGVEPAAISDVILTHARADHYGALSIKVDGVFQPAFPNVRHYLNRENWHPYSFDSLEKRTLQLIHQHGLLSLVDDIEELDDGLTLFSVSGETPGHQILRLIDQGRYFYFTGDLCHHPIEFVDESFQFRWATGEQMRSGKQAFINRASELKGLIYFTHIEGPYRVEKRDGYFRWSRLSVDRIEESKHDA